MLSRTIIYILLLLSSFDVIADTMNEFDKLIVLPEPQNKLTSKTQKAKWRITPLNHEYTIDDVEFFDAEHKKHFLDEFDGTTVLISFWAAWSDTASSFIPELDILQKDFRKLPFKVIPISIDYNNLDAINPFFKGYDVRYLPVYYDYKQTLFKAFKVTGIPTTILIDSKNRLVLKLEGNIQWHQEEIREMLLSYIDGNPAMPKNSYKKPVVDNSVKLPTTSNETIEDTEPAENQTEAKGKEDDNK